MKFIVGLATGIVIGAVGAVAYSVKSGTDLREAFEEVRSDVQKGDYDALGARLEKGFSDMQAMLDDRIGQIRASTASAIDEANTAIDEARSSAADAAGSAASEAGSAASDVAADAADAAADAQETLEVAADNAADAAKDAATR